MNIFKLPRFLVLWALIMFPFASLEAQNLDFSQRKNSLGKASLTSNAYYVDFTLGRANFSPELAMPIQIFYDSSVKDSGLLGASWRIPQLESTVIPDKDGAIWTSPWGEQIKFFSRKNTDSKTLELYRENDKGYSHYSPFADWVANGREDSGSWTFFGRKEMKGWKFVYVEGRLTDVMAPTGQSLKFYYNGKLVSVEQKGEKFIQLQYDGRKLSSILINGIAHKFSFAEGKLRVLPETKAGRERTMDVAFLASVFQEGQNPLEFKYDKLGYLSQIKRGEYEDNIRPEQSNNIEIAGRILADRSFKYSYPKNSFNFVEIANKEGRKAYSDYDSGRGILRHGDFSGKEYTTYYYMRYDVAYNGQVRQVLDSQRRVVANYRYDKETGKITRFRDIAKNDINYTYDKNGNLVLITKRGAGEAEALPVRSFTYNGKGTKPFKVNVLDEAGNAVQTTSILYNSEERPISIDDGRRSYKITYNAYGYPKQITDTFGNITLYHYDRYNRLKAKDNPNGIKNVYDYDQLGRLIKSSSVFNNETIAYTEVSYDKNGSPESFKDQDGFEKAYERDPLGRILREIFPDDTEVAYSYSDLGKLSEVTDQNGNKIKFDWGQHGLSSRTTAVGQITENSYDKFGRLASVSSKFKDKPADKSLKYEYDEFDRISKIDYGNGQIETFKYDTWGRPIEQSKNALKSEFKYDHFGRLVEKREGISTITYTYDNYGKRLSRVTKIGPEVLDEYNTYDKYGRLVKTVSSGKTVEYVYNKENRLAEQIIDGNKVVYSYTKLGQLERKAMLDAEGKTITELKYVYSKSGKIASRLANGKLQSYKYDAKNQLLAVIDAESGKAVEEYVYDPAGNILKKTVDGITTEYAYDATNQLVSSTTNGKTITYAYDAAGRMVREGEKNYSYGWLDKVMSVAENGKELAKFEYHNNGQIAKAIRGDEIETFVWDNLALIGRNGTKYINEPHSGGGNPILAIDSLGDIQQTEVIFTDIFGTSLGRKGYNGYSEIEKTAFGNADKKGFFTGKPYINELGYAFLFRNYRADIGKWQIKDVFGYPDGWNNMAYCNNSVIQFFDFYGATISSFGDAINFYAKNTDPNAEETIGNNVLNEFFSTNEYSQYEQGLRDSAKDVSTSQNSGSLNASSTVSWSQGLVLGRTASKTTDSLNWSASDWTSYNDTQESRTITVTGNLVFTTNDRWDFKAHEGDSWYNNLIKETIPGGIATIYSYLTQFQGGTPYNLSGSITKNISFTVTQYRNKNE